VDFVFRRSYRGPLKGVIVDWAGTTLDYGCMAPAVVFLEVFRRKGVAITLAQAREPMGANKRVHIEAITRMPAVAQLWREVQGHEATREDIDALYADFLPLQIASLTKYSALIPGTIEAMADFRKRGLKVGSTTGYVQEIMEPLQEEARKQGFAPDCMVCGSDVPAGRPHPWMCFKNAMELGLYPMEALVKIGDTMVDIEEGLNAGMWTIGLSRTGNEMGLLEHEVDALDPGIRRDRIEKICARFYQAGAHYVVDGIADVSPILDEIQERLAGGEKP
jgi:phosphonoacetaldehyde hydrolase